MPCILKLEKRLFGGNTVTETDETIRVYRDEASGRSIETPRSGRGTSHSAVSPAESQLTSSTAQAIRSETRQPATGNIDRVDTTSSHYASAGYYGANRNDGFGRNGSSNRGDYLSTLDRTSGRVNRNVNKTPLPEFHAKNSHIQRSNYASLLEFNQPSKKFETQPEYRERGVDVGPVSEVTSREQEAGQVEEGVSSYRSITEMYHAAETADQGVLEQSQQGELVVEQRELTMAEQFAQVVLPIRGFGPRKLTEQELGRWRSLVSGDSKFIELVQSATTVEEIEQEPTSNLQSSHSRSQLNVYVGNVGTDW